MAKTLKHAPYMVASYNRCEDVRKLLAQTNILNCVRLFKMHVEHNASVRMNLKFEVDKILALEKRVFELERTSFLTDRNLDTSKMDTRQLMEVVHQFAKNAMTIGEIESYIKQNNMAKVGGM